MFKMDPRVTPANETVACSTLKGKIKHANFVEAKNYQVNVPFVDLLGSPDGKRNRQLIYGSKVSTLMKRRLGIYPKCLRQLCWIRP